MGTVAVMVFVSASKLKYSALVCRVCMRCVFSVSDKNLVNLRPNPKVPHLVIEISHVGIEHAHSIALVRHAREPWVLRNQGPPLLPSGHYINLVRFAKQCLVGCTALLYCMSGNHKENDTHTERERRERERF